MARFRCSECDKKFNKEALYNAHKKHLEENGTCQSASSSISCDFCSATFSSVYTMRRHLNTFHPDPDGKTRVSFACGICHECFDSAAQVKAHRDRRHNAHTDFQVQKSAHGKTCQLLRAHFQPNVITLEDGLFKSYHMLVTLIEAMMSQHVEFKLNFILHLEMYRYDDEGEIAQMEVFPFRAFGFTVGRHNLPTVIDDLTAAMGQVDKTVDEFLLRGSGWIVNKPMFIDAEVVKCLPLTGAGCGLHEAKYIRDKGFDPMVVGDSPNDGMCFYYAVAAGLMGGHSKPTINQLDNLIQDQIEVGPAPMPVSCIDDFERAHKKKFNLGIVVVYLDDERDEVYPLRASSISKPDHLIVLCLSHTSISNGKSKDEIGSTKNTMHYSLVRDPGKFMAKRMRDDSDKTRSVRKSYCFNCFASFFSEAGYEKHIEECHKLKGGAQIVRLPQPGETRKYESRYKNKTREQIRSEFKSAYTVFADFEAFQVEPLSKCGCPPDVLAETDRLRKRSAEELIRDTLDEQMTEGEQTMVWENKRFEYYVQKMAKKRQTHEPSTSAREAQSGWNVPRESLPVKYRDPPPKSKPPKTCPHKTLVEREQPPFSYHLVMVNRNGSILESETYHGVDAAEHFLSTLLILEQKYLPRLTPGTPMEPQTPFQAESLDEVSDCYLCGDEMAAGEKVLDHDHLTGQFLGVAHSECNLKRREDQKLTVFFHNFSGYDSHFVVKAMANVEGIQDVEAIPLNTQKFKTILLNKRIRFLDSYAFLSDSLAKLTDMLRKSGHQFPMMAKGMELTENQLELCLRKGVYPYSFATSMDSLINQKVLPSISEFYDQMGERTCDPEDYNHAKQVWETFGCRNMLDYTTLYVKTDVFLLAEIVTHFRQMIFQTFGLDMVHYFSLPHMAMDIMLKRSEVEIELMSDQEMVDLLQKNIRGGLSFANVRHSTRVTSDDTDNEKDHRVMCYVDANNLYGKAMTFPMPKSGFEWVPEEELVGFDVDKEISLGNGTGYILEVDLEYPNHLHILHNSFPLAPETMDITWDDLSPFSKSAYVANGNKPGSYKATKLTATFRKREKYLVHGINLKFYLEQGLVLKKIHRAIRFYQEDFMAPFIEECTRHRMTASTVCEQNMWKLVCNSVYGKLIESLGKRMDCKFNWGDEADKKFLRNATNPRYKSSIVCDENYSISFLQKKEVFMRQSFVIGFSILELSKYIMQDLYYNKIQSACGMYNVQVMMSDTDSFLLNIRAPNEKTVMEKLSSVMDFSNYPLLHSLYDGRFKKVPGYLKNELPNSVIEEAVAIKSKVYAIKSRKAKSEEEGGGVDRASDVSLLTKIKGVKKGAQEKLSFQTYKNCLFQSVPEPVEIEQYSLRSKNHTNQLVRSRKVAFTSFDDKRYQTCEIHSVPYGSSQIFPQFNDACGQCTDQLLLA